MDAAKGSITVGKRNYINTYNFSKVDKPKKDPFLSSCILLLFKILWRENVCQHKATENKAAIEI